MSYLFLKGEPNMKLINIKSIAAVAIVSSMGVAAPAVAFADSTTTTTTAPGVSVSATANASAWTAFQKDWKAYVDGLRSIRLTYRASVETSRAAYLTAMAAATTPAEKQAARLALDASLSADLNARIAAITAAGDPPSPPAGYNGTAWVEGFQAANVAFRASIVTAQTALSQSLATATTAWDRKAARLTYQLAVGNAMVVHSTAIEALGTPPTHRGRPS
jgi:hypothetical protein